MIINASGRTDIVAYYMDWFVNRRNEGYFDVRNPFNPKLVSRIFVSDVDMIVFCTKNPLSLLDTIHVFSVPIQLQVTITGYFKDTILLNSKYNVDYHVRAFNKLCTMLKGYVSKIIVSFVDDYKNVRNNHLDYHEPSNEEYLKLKEAFEKNDMKIVSCMENKYQIGDEKDCCISIKYAFERTGKLFQEWKARDCHCVNMVDVGAYNSCLHGCKYCYANFDSKQIVSNYKMHDVNSSLLIGHLNLDDQVKIRRK